MTTAPIRIIHTGPVPLTATTPPFDSVLELAATVLTGLAGLITLIAVLFTHPAVWVQIVATAMLAIAVVALAALTYRRRSTRMDEAIRHVLGR